MIRKRLGTKDSVGVNQIDISSIHSLSNTRHLTTTTCQSVVFVTSGRALKNKSFSTERNLSYLGMFFYLQQDYSQLDNSTDSLPQVLGNYFQSMVL